VGCVGVRGSLDLVIHQRARKTNLTDDFYFPNFQPGRIEIVCFVLMSFAFSENLKAPHFRVLFSIFANFEIGVFSLFSFKKNTNFKKPHFLVNRLLNFILNANQC